MSPSIPVWLIVDDDELVLYDVTKLPASVTTEGPAAFLKTRSLWSLLFPDLNCTADQALNNDITMQALGKEYVALLNKNDGMDNEESLAISSKMDARLKDLRELTINREKQLKAAHINIDLIANPDIPAEYRVVKVFKCDD